MTYKCKWWYFPPTFLSISTLMMMAILVLRNISFVKGGLLIPLSILGILLFGLSLVNVWKTKHVTIHPDRLDLSGTIIRPGNVSSIVASGKRQRFSIYRSDSRLITVQSKDPDLLSSMEHWCKSNRVNFQYHN